MSDEIFVEKLTTKEGVKDGRTWKRTAAKNVLDGEWYSTFDEALAAKLVEGKRFKVEYESKPVNGRVIRDLKTVELVEAEEPQSNGDGTYVKAKENPSTQRSISAAVALQSAVATVSHTIGKDTPVGDAADRVNTLASHYFRWLLQRTGLETDSDIPF